MVAAMGAQSESLVISIGMTATAVEEDVWNMGRMRLHPAINAASFTE